LFAVTDNLKHCTLLNTSYAAGLRVSEVVHLKVSDSDRMMLWIEQGKRQKDRYALPSEKLIEQLRNYWSLYRPSPMGRRSAR
jgi:integrase/recombinase XerD